MGVMNTVTSADSSYYAANTNEKTEKGPCLAMTPHGVIELERGNYVFVLLHLLSFDNLKYNVHVFCVYTVLTAG